MLSQLKISNYAIIENIQVEFQNGLTIITGETGAGKSILMGALQLILGQRADASVLLNKDQKSIIEGIFRCDGNTSVNDFLQANDLDSGHELIIRREIASTGKSRAFINDTPVTLQQLKQLGSLLVDLHQQFDNLDLGKEDFQRLVIDSYAAISGAVATYRQAHKKLSSEISRLETLIRKKEDQDKAHDYTKFLFDELSALNFSEGELERLEKELQVLDEAENIRRALDKISYYLKDGDEPVVGVLKQQLQQLQPFKELSDAVKEVYDRILSTQIELKDVADEAENIGQNILFDEERAAEIRERISEGYRLLKKHSVTDTNSLIAIQNRLEESLHLHSEADGAITALKQKIEAMRESLEKEANDFFAARKKAIPLFEKEVSALLSRVGMPNARLQVSHQKTTLNQWGIDDLEFLFDANRNNHFQPLLKVASGGELSRLMLCIKNIVAGKLVLPTMIFDEIDTGISGEAAKQVGIIMKQLAIDRQIICITHQPQIAGRGQHHLFVYKTVEDKKVKTGIKNLSTDERIDAVAKMIAGDKPTTAAIENARELIASPA